MSCHRIRVLVWNSVSAASPHQRRTSQTGSYTVVVVGPGGSVTSQAAVLSLVPFSRLANVSVRSMAGRGEQSQTLGFCIGGTGSKQVLCRGIGPGLLNHGVVGVLPDPRIAMYDSKNVLIHQNDDWGGGAALTAAFASAYAFALQGNSMDAALLVTLQPGVYCAQVSSVPNATGVALVEIYEVVQN